MRVRSDEDDRRAVDIDTDTEEEVDASLDFDECLLKARVSENREGFDFIEEGEDESVGKLENDDAWDLRAFFDLDMGGVGAIPDACCAYLS